MSTIIESGISYEVLGWGVGVIGVIAYASIHVIYRKRESELNVRFDVRLSIFIGGVVVMAMELFTKAAKALVPILRSVAELATMLLVTNFANDFHSCSA